MNHTLGVSLPSASSKMGQVWKNAMSEDFVKGRHRQLLSPGLRSVVLSYMQKNASGWPSVVESGSLVP